jgi:aminoglycoside phosphotransferase (APT) family kinase protein
LVAEAVTGLDSQLEPLLRAEIGDPSVQINDIVRLTGGASRETWSFTAVGSDATVRRLILRRDPPGVERPGGMAREAAALWAAAKAGVPEPALLVHHDDPTALGAPFIIMDHVDGETIARRILRDAEYAGAREFLARQCGEILARIHALDRSDLPDLDEPDPLARCAESLEALDEPRPVLDLGLRWLVNNRPEESGRRTVVHGDFRNGNLIIGPEGVRAVLDWEIVHWGDPAEDLGWMCVKAWRFGAKAPVGGFGSYEELLDGYIAAGGVPVDLETLKWWETLGTLRWGLGCIAQSRRHLDGAVRSVELAAIGRRACEQEWDLLDLLRQLTLRRERK